MNFQTVWAVYFSATDTTKKVVATIAESVAQQAGVPVKAADFTLPSVRKEPLVFGKEDLVIFGTPVYAGRVPNLLIKYVAAAKGNGAIAVPVVLYGNRSYDDALMELRNTLETGGFYTVAGAAFVGEHAFTHSLAAGRPNEEDLTIAQEFARQVAKKVADLATFSGHTPVYVKGNDPIHPYFQPRDGDGNAIDIRKVKVKTNENCVKCKRCAKHCPMGSISMENPSEIIGICIKCNSCVKKCPKGAKYFSDPNYLFHVNDLIEQYSQNKHDPELFL